MSAHAIRRPDNRLPAGARAPLAIVAAILCAASVVPCCSQIDIAMSWREAPHLAPHTLPLAAALQRARTRAARAPQAVVASPARSHAMPALALVKRASETAGVAARTADTGSRELGPPAAFAAYGTAGTPPLPSDAPIDGGGPGALVVANAAAGPLPLRGNTFFVSLAGASTHNFNEFSSGQWRPESFMLAGAYLLGHPRLALKIDYREDVYVTNDTVVAPSGVHQTPFTTPTGAYAQTPVFYARQSTLDLRAEAQVAAPLVYLGVGYIHTANNYHYAQLNGAGFGIEKMPDIHAPLSFYGSAFYYPAASGTSHVTNPSYASGTGPAYHQSYAIGKYDAGVLYKPVHAAEYFYAGYSADVYDAKEAAPIDQVHSGTYAGLGVKF